MNRLQFLKNAALGAAVTPVLLKELLSIDPETDSVVISEPGKKRVAIDIRAISNTGIIDSKGELSAKDILELYFETGVLLYRRTPGMPPEYTPITVID